MSKEGNQNFMNNKRGRDIDGAEDFMMALREHRLVRKGITVGYRLMLYCTLFTTQAGRDVLNDPERRRIIYDREARTGLLEDSIIGDDLYVPNGESTSLQNKLAVAGRYVSYDFNRPKEFKSVAKNRELQNDHGRLVVFVLDEIKYNDKNDYTPTDLLNIFDLLHILSFETFSPEEAVEQGFLRKTTYEEAYKKVGLFNKYKLSLELQQLNERTIYAVTPKGNGVVCLIRDGGERQKYPKGASELSRLPFPMPI